MPKFYKNRRYVNKKGQQFGKGVWVDDFGNIIYPGQSRMVGGSRETRTVTQYNSDGTKTVYPWEEWAKKSQREHEIRVLQNDRKYAIPYIPEKRMTITIDENSPTRSMAGATFSENMLDSIAINAKRAGLPFSTAIGLVAQESTFGKGERGAGKSMLPWNRVLNASSGDVKDKAKAISYNGYYSPSLLISNWKQRQEGPFYDYFYNEKGTLLEKPKNSQFYDEDINSARVKANKYHLVDESPLEHGFRKYEKNPEEWNHNNPNYPQEVKEKSSELVNYSPEIRNYMKENHLHAGGGSLDQPLPWGELSLSEKAEIIKKAVGAGVHSLRDIKSAYNSQIEGNSYACGGHLFKKGGNQNSSISLAQKAMQYFVGKGLTQEQAAGLVGNLQRESGLNYQAINPNGGAVGIAQWLGSRKKKLFEKYGKNPTFDDQLDYVWYELNTTHKNGLKKLKESKTVDDAAMNAFGYYEFSAGPAAAIKSMNRYGMNTKWKNGDGSKAMTRGIMNGRKLLGQVPYTPTEAVETSQVTAIPQFLFESNPTGYGTPVDYSTPVRPVAEEVVPTPVEEKQNSWGIFNFIQSLGTPQQAIQPLASYQLPAENSSPYVVEVPSASTTMLNASWFAGGGPLKGSYSDWKKAIAEYKGINPDKDSTYDYEGYYNQYPAQAWAMLGNDPEAHFVDEFKTVYHPTFSDQSKYSGIVDVRFNPEGIIGGTWSENGKRYTLSDDQARHRWDVGRTMYYMGDAEDNGVQRFYPDGRHWTTAEGDIWGGVLPAVTVSRSNTKSQ